MPPCVKRVERADYYLHENRHEPDPEILTLDELAGGWGLSEADLRYVAENGLLKLSVRVVGVLMKLGTWEETADRESMSIPYARCHHDGLLDLHKRDVFTLFRDGRVELRHFLRSDGYAWLLRDEDVISLRRQDVVERVDERQRFGAAVLPTLRVETSDFGDFSDFLHEGRRCRFTPTQARVLRFLYDAAGCGRPWQSGKAALAASGSHSLKLGDLFKRRPEWRAFIEADGRGCYRLTSALTRRRAA